VSRCEGWGLPALAQKQLGMLLRTDQFIRFILEGAFDLFCEEGTTTVGTQARPLLIPLRRQRLRHSNTWSVRLSLRWLPQTRASSHVQQPFVRDK
jgi:hypothetical protein